MKGLSTFLGLISVFAISWAEDAPKQGWAVALPGYQITLPRDHFPHYQFRTEWWYFTGNLQAADDKGGGGHHQITPRGDGGTVIIPALTALPSCSMPNLITEGFRQ